jgi:hypothetical protein
MIQLKLINTQGKVSFCGRKDVIDVEYLSETSEKGKQSASLEEVHMARRQGIVEM